MIEAITGHNYPRHFSNKISILKTTRCRLCNKDPETFLHLANICSQLTAQRLEIFNFTRFEGKHSKWNPVKLMEFLNLPQIKILFTNNQ